MRERSINEIFWLFPNGIMISFAFGLGLMGMVVEANEVAIRRNEAAITRIFLIVGELVG
jgi:hypothetical protein